MLATLTPQLAALERWLSARIDLAGPLTVEPISGGRSNVTYQLSDGSRHLVLRHPPKGPQHNGAHDVGREYRIMSALADTAVPVPEPVAFCDDEAVLGVPFSVVEYVPGHTLRDPADLAALSPAGRARVTPGFASALAALHAQDPAITDVPVDKGRQYVARQLRTWQRQLCAEPRRPLPVMDLVQRRLSDSIPTQRRVAVVHGDYRLDNVLVSDDGEPLAIVDWELWTLGDPLADLGAALAYWVDGLMELAPLATAPTITGELGTRADLLSAYSSAGGHRLTAADLDWYVAFGLWRFAAILEGVYRRNLTKSYGDDGNDNWRRYEYVVPTMAEIALQQLRHST